MGLDEVRKVVQPELDQDFDALYEEFVEETGQKDVVEFLLQLRDPAIELRGHGPNGVFRFRR